MLIPQPLSSSPLCVLAPCIDVVPSLQPLFELPTMRGAYAACPSASEECCVKVCKRHITFTHIARAGVFTHSRHITSALRWLPGADHAQQRPSPPKRRIQVVQTVTLAPMKRRRPAQAASAAWKQGAWPTSSATVPYVPSCPLCAVLQVPTSTFLWWGYLLAPSCALEWPGVQMLAALQLPGLTQALQASSPAAQRTKRKAAAHPAAKAKKTPRYGDIVRRRAWGSSSEA